MILILRGHIRHSFENADLFYFVKKLYEKYQDLKIFIHTWNILSNNLSWRTVITVLTVVTKEQIYHYFDSLNHLIKHIIIDDDSKIQLHGNIQGKLAKTNMPILGWKNYWYGNYSIIKHIYDTKKYSGEMVINTRFDVFNNSNSLTEKTIFDFIDKNQGLEMTKNSLLWEKETFGIDNFYIGNIDTMYKLAYAFNNDLDDIESKNGEIDHQEYFVLLVNNMLG
jgi:hypothetical protein